MTLSLGQVKNTNPNWTVTFILIYSASIWIVSNLKMSSVRNSTMYLKNLRQLAHYGHQPCVQITAISEWCHYRGSWKVVFSSGLFLIAPAWFVICFIPNFPLWTFSRAISSLFNVASLKSAIICNPTLQVLSRMCVLCWYFLWSQSHLISPSFEAPQLIYLLYCSH